MSTALGLKTKKYVNIEETSEVLVISDYITYEAIDIEEMKSAFNDLKDESFYREGYFTDCEFDDPVWYARDYKDSKYKLSFEFGTHPDIDLALKCYIIAKLQFRTLAFGTIDTSLKICNHYLRRTQLVNAEAYNDFILEYKELPKTEKSRIFYFKEFIEFYQFKYADVYIDFIGTQRASRSSYRKIPNYGSIIAFDSILNEYYKNINQIDFKSNIEALRYFPVYLWWKISSIIPLRPIEFCLLSSDCCSYDKSSDAYYLKIERKKIKNSELKQKKIPLLNVVKTTKEIYDIIEMYKEVTADENTSGFLLSYETYLKCSFHDMGAMGLNRMKHHMYSGRVINTIRLNNILNAFYKNIVQKEFGYLLSVKGESGNAGKDIEPLNPGDSRHIAMCNLMLQGFNPLTIAQLAGHKSFREQIGYYNHINKYMDASTYVLAKSLYHEEYLKISDFKQKQKWKEDQIKKDKLGDKFYSLLTVKGGRCDNKAFPVGCILDDCIFCREHFIYDNSLTMDNLEAYEERLAKQIDSKIESIKKLTSGMIYTEDWDYDKDHQSEHKKETNLLLAFMEQKATIQAYKLFKEGESYAEEN